MCVCRRLVIKYSKYSLYNRLWWLLHTVFDAHNVNSSYSEIDIDNILQYIYVYYIYLELLYL